ncbi:MAG: tripartite tricarboxylate transporter TctB family protein [Armatimonadota bacterium]|nr:tripartite tricarboxylate transporter TctB family protein [Armatimonadota bacterium]MDW8156513.1 tripartite tricarboxylate transporter TctB family protein [Armatimonadota bacterium]
MRRADLVAGMLLLAVAAVYFHQSLFIARGFADRLGPAFVPRLLAGALAVLALALLVRAVGGRSEATPPPEARTGLLVVVLALLVGYALLMPKVGFLWATPVLLAAVLLALGVREPLPIALTAVGVTAALYGVFGRLLGVLLPGTPGRL